MSLGTRLLRRDDAEGCALVRQAIELDDALALDGCALLRDYHWRHGNANEAAEWHRRCIERAQVLRAAADERKRVSFDDDFEPHGLSDDVVAKLRVELRAVTGGERAYMVRKRVAHLPGTPCYVFGFSVGSIFRVSGPRRARNAMREIQQSVHFPGDTLIVSVDAPNRRFGRRLRGIGGSRIL